ncbi:plasmid mobilization relaxosome protein MobC (plasmid) [Dermatophilaceae bacterium Sec6.4]
MVSESGGAELSGLVGVDRWVAAGEAARAELAKSASVAEKRDRVVAVRLFPAELVAWQEAAVNGGRREVGRWVRETINAVVAEGDDGGIVKAPRGPARPGVELAALARIGNNLNQAVRLAHMRTGDSVVAQDLVDAVDRAQVEIRALREAL